MVLKSPPQEEKETRMWRNETEDFRVGRMLANPAPGEEVCITGMAGRFPESDDVYELRYNLLHKVDMVTGDNRRWVHTNPEIPHRTGKINYLDKLDAGFFGVHYRFAKMLDPMCRTTLERAIEAIMDAGYHPEELRGSRTGVFIAVNFSESERTWLVDNLESPTYGILGGQRSMIAQRISYALGLKGRSLIADTGCGSSLYAFHQAYNAIRTGQCEMALVGGVSLCLNPITSLQFVRLGVLSSDGSCKSFDNDANGYARSEAVSVVLLQKTKNARRIYAQVIHLKTNSDGFKEQGVGFPSNVVQQQLMMEIYRESDIDPSTVDFIEAHAAGTKIGDPEEIFAIDRVFCKNRKSPLYVGSTKSCLGHSEPASGMCGIIKVLLSMENDCLLPNINYNSPREEIDALKKGRIVAVADAMSWPVNGSGLAAINCFGFGGSNAHLVLKRPTKRRSPAEDDLPRLICFSGRTKDAITHICNDLRDRTLNIEFVRLLQEVFKKNFQEHAYRGYMLISTEGVLNRSMEWFDGETKPACLVFGTPNRQWVGVGRDLLAVPQFAASIQRIHNSLSPQGVNVIEILNSDITKQDVFSIIIGNVAIQIALVEILKILDFHPDYVIGYSMGELVAAYSDEALTLKETVLSALHIAISLNNSSVTTSLLLNNKEYIDINAIPTVSNGGSWFGLAEMRANILQGLEKIIPQDKRTRSKWVVRNNTPVHVSAEYFTESILNPIPVCKTLSTLPVQSILIEVGSISNNFSKMKTISLVTKEDTKENSVKSLLNGLGRIYSCGYSMSIEAIYPKIAWPVSSGTPMVSPLIKWNYAHDWPVAFYETKLLIKDGERKVTFNIKGGDSFLTGHVVDDLNVLPATAYLFAIWETYAIEAGVLRENLGVVFEDIKFQRATTLTQNAPVTLTVSIQTFSGYFEVVDDGQIVVSGKICSAKDFSREDVELSKAASGLNPLTLTDKCIYKKLKLKGYNYTGEFRAVKEWDVNSRRGLAEWTGNWVTFLDALLQVKVLQEDNRILYLPTRINRLVISPKTHIRRIQETGEKAVVPVYLNNESNIIKAGGVEIRGLILTPIPRRKTLEEPILEVCKFIPFESELTVNEAVRVFTQIVVENSDSMNVRAVEYIEKPEKGALPLSPLVFQAFKEQPRIKEEVIVITEESIDVPNVTVENKKLSRESSSCSLVIVSNIFDRLETQKQAINALRGTGFIISREELTFKFKDLSVPQLDIIGVYKTEEELLILFRRSAQRKVQTVIDMSESTSNFDWLTELQAAMENDEDVVVFSQNNPLSGILGFYNCVRHEPDALNVRCVFVMDKEAPKFDIKNNFYIHQLKKGLTINIFKDGKWGTYRHLRMPKEKIVQREHVYCNVTVKGDLFSLRWIEGPLTSKSFLPPGHSLIQVYYTSLNVRDVVAASSRISSDYITRDRLKQEIVQGFEFVGRNRNGKRVMGMMTTGALTSMIDCENHLIMNIPESLTMEEAATIPIAYGTILYSCIDIIKLQFGENILIHAGSDALGQAAINVALFYKCNIFTTVSNEEERNFIRKIFPSIPETHIGNIRGASFKEVVMKETKGYGVDVIINSLAEEALQVFMGCLAPSGRFLEIGKAGLVQDNPLKFKNLGRSRSYHSVMLDDLCASDPVLTKHVGELILNGIENGYVKPLNRKIFASEEEEEAYRYVAAGKHMGKVVIKIRDEEPIRETEPEFKLFSGISRFYGNPNKSYILVGGLGGFALELVDWMILRGARRLVLVSRTGVKSGYQAFRIRLWKSYGATVNICTADVTTKQGCKLIIKEANSLGPVEGIFNLAVVLKDGLLKNLREESFKVSLAPKALPAQHLDELSRELCPELKHFVMFSSVSCGRGQFGQTNYGMSNSVMERICELRRSDGLPAVAIQWGAIGDVGLVAEMQELETTTEVAGTLQQGISSCLDVLDTFLTRKDAIVSSMVVVKKKNETRGVDNIIEVIKKIIGLKDLKSISVYSTLPELGMNSMMTMEVKQALDKEYPNLFTAQDIRKITFAKLQDIARGEELQDHAPGDEEHKEAVIPQDFHLLSSMIDEENGTTVL